MDSFPASMQRMIRELSKLPSIGEKSASRLAYHLVSTDKNLANSLASALVEAAEKVGLCTECFHLSENTTCDICSNPNRDDSIICVVEKPMDLIAMERVSEFRGRYHVLHGLWAPLRGQGPESIKITELIERVKRNGVKEVIVATSSTVEGDATALYIGRALEEFGVNITRLAQGMPKGGELEYADEITLSRALSGRTSING